MSTEKLDEMVLDILEKAGKQMTIREIERRVADRGVEPSTLDIQKSARRLVAAQRAELTPDLYIKARR